MQMQTTTIDREHSGETPCDSSSAVSVRAFHPWITDELFAETRRVWSKSYGRVLSDEEIVEILGNVRRMAEAIMFSRRRRYQRCM